MSKPKHKSLALIAETPARDEERRGQFLVGNTGRLVDDRILQPTRIRRSALHISNALLCWPREGLEPAEWRQAIECCRPRLEAELKAVKPRAVLTLGKWAMYALTGHANLGDWVGAPLKVKRGRRTLQVLPTFHPAMLFRDKWGYLPVLRIHFLRAWAMAQGNLKPWSWGRVVTPDNAPSVTKRLLKSLAKAKKISVDIETTGIDPFTDRITSIGFADKKRAVSVEWSQHPKEVLALLHGPALKIFQNGIFDRTVLRAKGIRVLPPYRDTLTNHLILAPELPHKLAFQCAVEFHAPRWKDDFHGKLGELLK